MRSQSPEARPYRSRDLKRRDDSGSDSYRRQRSNSPQEYIRDSLREDGRSPPRRRHRSRHDDQRHSRRERSSRSPPLKHSDSKTDHRRSSHRKPHRRSRSPDSRSLSPPRRHSHSKRSTRPLPSQKAAFNNNNSPTNPPPSEKEKQKPNYAPTGKLAAETNTVANTTIVLKYNEPPESRLPPPTHPYLLYIFKDKTHLSTLPLHERTCWLFGREQAVVDQVTEHPSCSKQHAVVQFRYVEGKRGEFGERGRGVVRPYVIDLESANGTVLNGERVPERRFLELRSGDVLRFGESTREYVVLLPPREGEGRGKG
ncbi:hypothetical protein ACLMJK_000054 [Lecanora helva]